MFENRRSTGQSLLAMSRRPRSQPNSTSVSQSNQFTLYSAQSEAQAESFTTKQDSGHILHERSKTGLSYCEERPVRHNTVLTQYIFYVPVTLLTDDWKLPDDWKQLNPHLRQLLFDE